MCEEDGGGGSLRTLPMSEIDRKLRHGGVQPRVSWSEERRGELTLAGFSEGDSSLYIVGEGALCLKRCQC